MTDLLSRLPHVRGAYHSATRLAQHTWFGVGGPAGVLYCPLDEDDLAAFGADLRRLIEFAVTCLEDRRSFVLGQAEFFLELPEFTVFVGIDDAVLEHARGVVDVRSDDFRVLRGGHGEDGERGRLQRVLIHRRRLRVPARHAAARRLRPQRADQRPVHRDAVLADEKLDYLLQRRELAERARGGDVGDEEESEEDNSTVTVGEYDRIFMRLFEQHNSKGLETFAVNPAVETADASVTQASVSDSNS